MGESNGKKYKPCKYIFNKVIKLESNAELLKKIGLTDYEVKTYLALTRLISANAGEISEESEVPRSKVYKVLEKLESKGFIEILDVHPLEYKILPPKDTFEKYKLKFIDDITKLQYELNTVYENNIPSFTSEVNLVEGKIKVVQKQYDIIRRTRNVILMRIGFIFPSEIDELKSQINLLLKKGVTVKILAAQKCVVNDEVISIKEVFEDVPIEVKYAKIPTAQLFIRDYNEMMLVFTENIGKSVSEKNTVGLLNTFSTIISNYVLAFNKHWYNK